MKHISIILTYLLLVNAAFAGFPPTTLKSQNGTKTTTFNYEVPNNQATKTSTGGLIETGNKNILSNASFEEQSILTGWTVSAGAAVVDTTTVIDGLRSVKLTLTAQAFTLHQDSTLYATQFANSVQGLAMIRIKTSVAGIKVCSRQAGVTSTSLCVDVPASGKWSLLKVPFILGATSNGISVHSNAVAVTGDVFFDDTFVGAVDLKQDVSSCATTDCEDTFGAKVSATDVVTEESLDWINGNCTNATAGLASCTFKTGLFSVAPNCTTTSTLNRNCYITSTTATGVNLSCSDLVGAATDAAFNMVCQKQGADFTSAQLAKNGSVYSSTNANYSRTSYTPTFVGLGTVGATGCKHSRDGEYLDLECNVSIGAPTGVTASVSLPVVNGTQLTIGSFTGGATTRLFGFLTRNIINNPGVKDYTVVGTSGASTLNFSFAEKDAATDPSTAQLGTTLFAASENLSFTARIPIAGWENSNQIIGSFNGVMTTPGVTKPKTCYYAFGGASATLAAPTECTTGTCVEVYDSCGTGTPPTWATTALYNNLTFASGTFASSSPIHCECKAYDVTAASPRECAGYFDTSGQSWSSNSSGGYVMNMITVDTLGAQSTTYVTVKCEGQAP